MATNVFIDLEVQLQYHDGRSVGPYVSVSLAGQFIGLWRPDSGVQIQDVNQGKHRHTHRTKFEHPELDAACRAVWIKNDPTSIIQTLVERIEEIERMILKGCGK